MKEYLRVLKDIRENGILKENRTGIDTFFTFGQNIRFNLQDGFPLVTTKKTYFKGIVEELLFFIKGETNSKHLEDKGVNIWKGNTSREFLDQRGLDYLPEGEIGCSYSHQWRNFAGEHPLVPETQGLNGFDQVRDVYNKLISDPTDRRIIISAWCPSQTKYMALPPCHLLYVFNSDPTNNTLNCHLTIRSWDVFLGGPFNIASLALLTHIMGKATGLTPNEICIAAVDAHIYCNHLHAVEEQLSRVPYIKPKVEIDKSFTSFNDVINLSYNDIKLIDYKYHPPIKAPMAV